MNQGTPSPFGSPQYSMYDLLKNGRRPKPAQSLYTGTTVVSPMQTKKKNQREPKKAVEPHPPKASAEKPTSKRPHKKKGPQKLSNSGRGKARRDSSTSSTSSDSASVTEASSDETSDTASLDVIRTGKKRLKDKKDDKPEQDIDRQEKPDNEDNEDNEVREEKHDNEEKHDQPDKEQKPYVKKLKVVKDKVEKIIVEKKPLSFSKEAKSLNDDDIAIPTLSLSTFNSTEPATTISHPSNISISHPSNINANVAITEASQVTKSSYSSKERSAKAQRVQYEKPQKITENGLVTLVTDELRETKPRGPKGRPKTKVDKEVDLELTKEPNDATTNGTLATNNTANMNANANANMNANANPISNNNLPRNTNSKVTINSHKKKEGSLWKRNQSKDDGLGKILSEKGKEADDSHNTTLLTAQKLDQIEMNESNNDATPVNTSDTDTLHLSGSGTGDEKLHPISHADKEHAPEKDDSGIALADLDLSHCERLESSYWRRPEHYELKQCSGRTNLCNSVLNDTWISRPTGEEGSQFRNSYKNAAEEEMFRTEDDQFEFDLYIERNFSTMKKLIAIKGKISAMTPVEQSQCKLSIDEFGKLHIHTIKILYGMKNYPILQKALLESPLEVIPIILDRLKQKSQDWSVMKQQWVTKWAKEYQKYARKSLDHEGSNFKEAMKRLHDPNNIIHDAKERTEENCILVKFDQRDLYYDVKYLFSIIAQTNLSPLQQHKLDRYLVALVDLFFAKRPVPATVLIANPILFIFFRYIQMLYDYLLKAVEVASRPYAPVSYFPAACSLNSLPSDTERKVLNADKRVRYAFYFNNVVRLTKRAMEAPVYEDDLRDNFGVNSYVLFGLDKLITNIGNHFLTIVKDENTLKLCTIYLHLHAAPLDTYRRCVQEHIVLKSCFDLHYGWEECALRMFSTGSQPPERAGSLGLSLSDSNSLYASHAQPAKKKKNVTAINQHFISTQSDFLLATPGLAVEEECDWDDAEAFRTCCDGDWQALSLDHMAGDSLDVDNLASTREPVRILFDSDLEGDDFQQKALASIEGNRARLLSASFSPYLREEYEAIIDKQQCSVDEVLGDNLVSSVQEGERQTIVKDEMEAAEANILHEADIATKAVEPTCEDLSHRKTFAIETSSVPCADSWQHLFFLLQRAPANESNGQISTFFLKRNIERVRLKSNVPDFLATFSSCHLSNAVDRQQNGKLHYFKKTEDFFWRKAKTLLTNFEIQEHNNNYHSNNNHSNNNHSNNNHSNEMTHKGYPYLGSANDTHHIQIEPTTVSIDPILTPLQTIDDFQNNLDKT